METAIWVISIVAVIAILILYVITSVGSYSNSFVSRISKGKSDDKVTKKEKSTGLD
ncbi:MAG: hypothetical protein IPG02_00510 [Ignavibacteria bacterium]|jgi:uncharacterized membrane protein YqhA|nr:hypothetical protein [Ignavibacteria bacterium]MBK9226532.1 hypothetical protein [Ignavibacteria bacterium]